MWPPTLDRGAARNDGPHDKISHWNLHNVTTKISYTVHSAAHAVTNYIIISLVIIFIRLPIILLTGLCRVGLLETTFERLEPTPRPKPENAEQSLSKGIITDTGQRAQETPGFQHSGPFPKTVSS